VTLKVVGGVPDFVTVITLFAPRSVFPVILVNSIYMPGDWSVVTPGGKEFVKKSVGPGQFNPAAS